MKFRNGIRLWVLGAKLRITAYDWLRSIFAVADSLSRSSIVAININLAPKSLLQYAM